MNNPSSANNSFLAAMGYQAAYSFIAGWPVAVATTAIYAAMDPPRALDAGATIWAMTTGAGIAAGLMLQTRAQYAETPIAAKATWSRLRAGWNLSPVSDRKLAALMGVAGGIIGLVVAHGILPATPVNETLPPVLSGIARAK
jgi:hypothetical protein